MIHDPELWLVLQMSGSFSRCQILTCTKLRRHEWTNTRQLLRQTGRWCLILWMTVSALLFMFHKKLPAKSTCFQCLRDQRFYQFVGRRKLSSFKNFGFLELPNPPYHTQTIALCLPPSPQSLPRMVFLVSQHRFTLYVHRRWCNNSNWTICRLPWSKYSQRSNSKSLKQSKPKA